MARIALLIFFVLLIGNNSVTGNVIAQDDRSPRPVEKDVESEEHAYQRGRKEAQSDLANNLYKMQTYGGPNPTWYAKFIAILKNDYQIEMNSLAGCLVTKSLLAYVKGYNEISEPVIKRKHGNDIFARVEKQAIKETEREQKR